MAGVEHIGGARDFAHYRAVLKVGEPTPQFIVVDDDKPLTIADRIERCSIFLYRMLWKAIKSNFSVHTTR